MPTRRLSILMILTGVLIQGMLTAPQSFAQERHSLIADADPANGWTFDNGREFKGATGGLTVDANTVRPNQSHPSLKLVGDFTKGGLYVQAGRKIEGGLDPRELSMWVRSPDTDHFNLRIIDGGGQCHQIGLKCEISPEWQQIVLPLEKFFAKRGTADAVTNVTKYESWGGAKDGKWHGPATAMYVLIGPKEKGQVTNLWLGEVTIAPKPAEVVGADVRATIRLDELADGQHDWGSSIGQEFKGAKGSLSVVTDEPAKGQHAFKLAADFTGGGAYVAMIKDLKDLDAKAVEAIRFQAKSDNAATVTMSMVDATGQTHQRKGIKVIADGQWHEMAIKPTDIAGGEHWGGANNGKWQGAPQQLTISVTAGSDEKSKRPTLMLTDIRAEVVQAVFAQTAAFAEKFDGESLPAGCVTQGAVSVNAKAGRTGGALVLSRPLEAINEPISFAGPAFPVTPGKWQLSAATRSDLNSPDSSYNGVVLFESFDAAGRVIDTATLADVFRKHDWQSAEKIVELPKGASTARFRAAINKANGSFSIDDLSAAFLSAATKGDDRIARVLFTTAQLGNLLFPADSRQVTVDVECRKPLRDDQRTLTYVVRDYWGSEQGPAGKVMLESPEKSKIGVTYRAVIDLASLSLEIGRYYEIHAFVARDGQEPFENYTSLAILPEAVTRKYQPEEVPFTARNWDNRFPEYIRLTDRLGVRICGLWGGWKPKAPYKPEAPGLELAQSLGMGWLTTTPAASIERGKSEYDEAALRGGVRNLIQTYGKSRPIIINLGNEPHGKGDVVLRNVAAYKALYEEIKKTDPTIPVVATSVEPNEEYFAAGYGQYCDAFDFHIYESHENVRQSIGEYKALMKKYGCEKPIWSTELGLNSQGQTRHAVAVQVFKKFTTFFAAGGSSVSWFGLLYPDPEGKDSGSSGDSHNIFDCRFNHYAPRLDAVAYYNAVNAIAVKKFVGEQTYDDGVYSALFRDKEGQSLQVLWMEKGRADVGIPLPGAKDVQVIRIDGTRRKLDASGGMVTLSVTTDPMLVLYAGGAATLPEQLVKPAGAFVAPAAKIARGSEPTFDVEIPALRDASDDLSVVTPSGWVAALSSSGDGGKPGVVHVKLTPPANTSARELDLTIRIGDKEAPRGELYHRAVIGE